ncbi:MAG: VWA domain-containing protein [Thermomicrobiales bacterium]
MRIVALRWLMVVCVTLGMVASPIMGFARQAGTSGKTVNVELIVDASGSMGAATDTSTLRIDAAKQVLNEVISAIPDVNGVNVGLRVYGQGGNNTEAGRAESCQSTELLVPMDGVNATALKAQVDAIQPVGWTPLGLALQEAAKDFTEPASDSVVNAIVMVTDGLETCDADPVAIAKQLHDSDKGIITHVIGFGTTPEEQTILNGIAKAGEGELLGSNNAGQLMDALFIILEQLEVVETTGTGDSRESPLGVGRIGKVGDYEISVIAVTPNATDEILAINPYNELTSPNNQFFQARISVTYRGADVGQPNSDLNFQAVGGLAVGYTTFVNQCGVIDDPLFMISDLFPDGSAEANICWQIDAKDADSLVMYIESNKEPNDPPKWFSLGNPIKEVVDPNVTQTVVTPTPRVAKTKTPSTSAAGDTKSSRTQPIPVGGAGQVGNYSITVLDVTRDATEQVMATNPYNELTSPDNQMFLARVRIKYIGSGSGTPLSDLQFNSVGTLGVSYTLWGNQCGVYDESVLMVSELFADGEVEANVCWQIDSTDAESLLMYVETNSYPAETSWFSLGGSDERVGSNVTAGSTASSRQETPDTPVSSTFISLEASDVRYSEVEIRVPAGAEFTIELKNVGVLNHGFSIDLLGLAPEPIAPGDSMTITTALPSGEYTFYCQVAGHKEAGMVGTLIVE